MHFCSTNATIQEVDVITDTVRGTPQRKATVRFNPVSFIYTQSPESSYCGVGKCSTAVVAFDIWNTVKGK